MALSDKMRRMIALAKAMARARAEAVALLERIARRSAGQVDESAAVLEARRERLQRGARKTRDDVRAELPKMLSPKEIEELRQDGDTPLGTRRTGVAGEAKT